MIVINSIQILSDAEEDLEDGKVFYDIQEPGVGDYFWDSLISDIESLKVHGGVHTKEFGYFRMPSKRFPYSIYYDIEETTAFIIAVLPMRRNPSWVKKRLT